jgi:hypothetical protein
MGGADFDMAGKLGGETTLARFHIYTSSCVDMMRLDYTAGPKILTAPDVLLKFLRNREGRENRPQ